MSASSHQTKGKVSICKAHYYICQLNLLIGHKQTEVSKGSHHTRKILEKGQCSKRDNDANIKRKSVLGL